MENAALTRGVFESLESDDAARALELIVAPVAELRAPKLLRRFANAARLADVLWVVVHGIASLLLSCPRVPATDDETLVATTIDALVEAWRPRVNASVRAPHA